VDLFFVEAACGSQSRAIRSRVPGRRSTPSTTKRKQVFSMPKLKIAAGRGVAPNPWRRSIARCLLNTEYPEGLFAGADNFFGNFLAYFLWGGDWIRKATPADEGNSNRLKSGWGWRRTPRENSPGSSTRRPPRIIKADLPYLTICFGCLVKMHLLHVEASKSVQISEKDENTRVYETICTRFALRHTGRALGL
jgi:hypothetical protein